LAPRQTSISTTGLFSTPLSVLNLSTRSTRRSKGRRSSLPVSGSVTITSYCTQRSPFFLIRVMLRASITEVCAPVSSLALSGACSGISVSVSTQPQVLG